MKKAFILSVALSVALATFGLPVSSFAKGPKDEAVDKKNKQIEVLDKYEMAKISWDKQKGIPDFVTGKLSKKKVKTKQDAKLFLEEQKNLFDIHAGEFQVGETWKDSLGMTHFRTQLTVGGIPVYGSELLVHTNKQGEVVGMNGQVEPKLAKVNWAKRVKLSQDEAINKAEKSLSFTPKQDTFTALPAAKLFLYQDKNKWLPVYLVELQFIDPYPGRELVFVSAVNGKIVNSYNAVSDAATTGTGVGVNGATKTLNTYLSSGNYYLYDTTKAMSGIIKTYSVNGGTTLPGSYVQDADNNFNDASQQAAVDAHYNAGLTYDYFYNTFNRNSYDNNGASITSTVNYSKNYNNAFWNGSQMVYGDGDGTTFLPLSGALDVVGHELTHAVTDKTAGLVYQDQSGALNESMSDVFAVLIEAANGSPDWLVGEDVYTPGTSGDALRSLSDPAKYGQPAHMNDYVNTTADNGGVHTNSGIPNQAFYNIASAIGFDKSGKIYYRALTTYLTSQANFNDARHALLQAATDLYNTGSAEYNAVANGFAAVGIGATASSGSSTTADTYEPNDAISAAYGPLTSGTIYKSYISSGTDQDFYKFDVTGAGTITVNLGSLPADYDVYLYDGTGAIVGKSENSGTTAESISYSAASKGTFYVKVAGYNGASSLKTAYELKVSYPNGAAAKTAQWYYETVSAETPHPYPNNYHSGHNYAKAGAQKVAIHFAKFETESGYDFVEIKDQAGKVIASYDGTKQAFWAIVDGDHISTILSSDYSVNKYGYQIDQVAYFSDQKLNLSKSFTTPIE